MFGSLLGILLLIVGAPMALVAITGAISKKKDCKIEVKMASVGVSRNKQGQQAGRLLVIGLIVAMLMFTAWRMTSSVFTGYIDQMSNMVTVANIKESDVDVLKDTEGVDDISKERVADSSKPVVVLTVGAGDIDRLVPQIK